MINLEVMKLWTDNGCECGSGQWNPQSTTPATRLTFNKKTLDRSDIRERIKTGVWLLSCKATIPHGEFKAFAGKHGIPERLRRKLMAVARAFMDKSRLNCPLVSGYEAWSKALEVNDALDTFIGESTSWEQIKRGNKITK